MSNLIQVATEDKLYLEGIITEGVKTKPAVLYIHGFEGNFYQDNFSRILLNEFQKNNLTFLSGNTRGHDKDTDISTIDGKVAEEGSFEELLKKKGAFAKMWQEQKI